MDYIYLGDKMTDLKYKGQPCIAVRRPDGKVEYWQLRLYHLFSTDFALLDDKLATDFVNDLLTKALFWYESYLKWEDQNIDMDDYANEN